MELCLFKPSISYLELTKETLSFPTLIRRSYDVGESGVGSAGGMIRHPSLSQRVFALLLCNKIVLKRHLLAIISSGAVTFCCAFQRSSVGKSDFKP